MFAPSASQRILKVRRDYNAWVANETLEDYALRFTPRSFRRWSIRRVANTALGSVSFLALEAIGGAMTLDYGFQTAIAAIVITSVMIFLTGLPISYYAARYGVDMDLLTRGAGFGYLGSTATSLIYASFTFIFFALEAAIMALALQIYFGMPMWLGYIVCSVAVIPLVTHGVTLISRLQTWTQPVWLALLLLPYIAVLWREPGIAGEFLSFGGRLGDGRHIDLIGLGSATTIAFSLIAQIGEQVDFLRFLPPRTEANHRQWWAAVLAAGPGWIVPGMLKLIGGGFLAFLALQHEVDIQHAVEPTQMYLAAYADVFSDPRWAALATLLFVVVSQIKINVTNAYAGSLAWSNVFARITHSHPGRVVWLIFNVLIALVLMEFGVFAALEHVLGLYSNVAIAWIGAVVADLVVNKPLGWSPRHIEFQRAHLYDVNPVGFGTLIFATAAGMCAYAGLFGPLPQAFSAFITLASAFVCAPLIAWGTRGRYYIARSEDADWSATDSRRCVICENIFEGEDMASCPAYCGPICSLCCTLDVRCLDRCKQASRISDLISRLLRRILPRPLAGRISSHTGQYLISLSIACATLAGSLLAVYYQETTRVDWASPGLQHELWTLFLRLFAALALISTVVVWWFVLASESRHLAHEESNRQNLLLLQEIEARQRSDAEAERARKQAEAANEAKSRFLTGMSHELRTPLNSIIGYAQLMRRDRDLPARRQDAIAIMLRSGEHLLGLIDGMLDIARIESGRLRLDRQELHLNRLLQEVYRMFELQAQDRGLCLTLDVATRLPDVVHADTRRVRQILINLLSNAIKFTRTGGVQLRVSYLREMAQFEVIDTGVGIAAADLERIFLPFERGSDPGTRAEAGTGLGLTITKLLTEVMGGRLNVESSRGVGSRFTAHIYMPAVDRPVARSAPGQEIAGYTGSRRTILVVDDQDEQRTLLLQLLEPLGFAVVEANSGAEALAVMVQRRIAGDAPVDAVLLDVAMPGMSGWEVARRIRSGENAHTPIIMVSADAFENSAKRLADGDCDDFIVKPTLEGELLSALQRHLELNWAYGTDPQPDIWPACPLETEILRPEAEQLRSLRAQAEVGYLKGVLARLEEIEAADRRYSGFCRLARQRVAAFQLRQLMTMLEDDHDGD
ncbi:MAG: response regulator [Pseudomonadota bacterium]|nr:response regulator [Pseudomonadota bacterium]